MSGKYATTSIYNLYQRCINSFYNYGWCIIHVALLQLSMQTNGHKSIIVCNNLSIYCILKHKKLISKWHSLLLLSIIAGNFRSVSHIQDLLVYILTIVYEATMDTIVAIWHLFLNKLSTVIAIKTVMYWKPVHYV